MGHVILKSGSVRREETSHVRHAAAVSRGTAPEVRLVEMGGVVRAIEVRCACGDTITVELDVPGESRGASGPPSSDPGGAA